MARPWRDIMSYEDFKRIAKKTDKWDSVKDVAELIKKYHQLNKRSGNKLGKRRESLWGVAMAAEKWFKDSGTDKGTVARTGGNQPRGNHVDERNLPLERIMLTLTRRSLRKAQYLDQLWAYLGGARSSAQLIEYVRSPQERIDGLISLSVKMEQEDFMHRDTFEGGAMAKAFEDWCDDTQGNNIPFFLWLEHHPICTSPDKSDRGVHVVQSVEYVSGNRPSVNSKMRLLDLTGGGTVRDIDLTGGGTVSQLCDTFTAGYKVPMDKAISPKNQFGKGVACFVWAPNGDIFIARHCSGKFHHSSFLSGGNVKCAGMIAIRQGKVVEMSNNSGHYKPRLEEFREFVNFLQAKGVTADDCYLSVMSLQHLGDGYMGPISNFARFGRGGGLEPGRRILR
jgi:hypothetical protein